MSRRRGYVSAPELTVEVTVEPEVSELHEQGWHHEDECGTKLGQEGPAERGSAPTLYDVAQELHQQLHPAESLWFNRCTLPPCSDLAEVWG